MRLQDSLLLFDYVTHLLGGDYDDLAVSLQQADLGRRPDGQSYFYSTFEARKSRLQLVPANPEESLQRLKNYDLNILRHEAVLAENRSGFHLTYFQYLAALYTEIYLHRLADDPAMLLLDLNAYREAHFAYLPPYTANDLRKVAFWMATGSGKTLLMHLNLRQFDYYRPFQANNIILLTPGEALSRQHLQELWLSGFDNAVYALEARSGRLPGLSIQVLEITKLYINSNDNTPRGGVSLPTDIFDGPNLLLVDEGHKGTATKTDRETERTWRDIRAALVADGGFTFEYSATFAQVTENDDLLRDDYARAILYEYAYGRFHTDGYGKDFRVINLRNEDTLYGDMLLLGGLLTFYEQHRLYLDLPEANQLYQIASPLMVFVGAQVTAGPEVLQVVQFLDRVLRNPTWTIGEIEKLIVEGKSGLPGENGQDVFANAFSYLKTLNQNPAEIYADLCTQLFRGHGQLHLHLLNRADGEIGLRTADSAHDAYCGVINVGDASGFLGKVRRETDIFVGGEDHLTDSLFGAIDTPESPIAFLIGSKKFIEGWSSWRVSIMGLLRVGKNAGAQVLQLFGRGVRLKGLRMSLRRSEALPGSHPRLLPLLETMHIFGLKANYLETFLITLDREGVRPPVTRLLPIAIKPDLDQAGLQAVEVRPDYDFKQTEVVAFDPVSLDIAYDLMPKVAIGEVGQVQTAGIRLQPQRLSEIVVQSLPYDDLFYHALDYKTAKGWSNLYISRQAIADFFQGHVRLVAPSEIMEPKQPEHWAALSRIASALLQKGLEAFYYQQQRRAETREMIKAPVLSDHDNFPQVRTNQGQNVPAYQLKIPHQLLAEVEDLIADQTKRLQEALDDALPRLYMDEYLHLYWPLLLKDRAEVLAGGIVRFKEANPRVSSKPAGLEQSETQFVIDMRDFWDSAFEQPYWAGYEIYLLRNLPRKGIGFFQTAGFYPDFLLWLKRGDAQVLVFVDPKGLAHGSWGKVELLQNIRELGKQVGFPIFGYIVTQTPLTQIPIPQGEVIAEGESLRDWLRVRGVLQQQGNYITEILEEMKRAIEPVEVPAT